MKLQTIHKSLLEMGKPAQVCPKCGHSPMHKTHTYYKGEWKCKNAPLPGFPQGSQSAAPASPAAQPAPAATTPAPAASTVAAPAVPKPTSAPVAPRTVTPVAGGPSITMQSAKTAPPTAVPPASRDQNIKVFMQTHDISKYTVNPDGSVDIHEHADFTTMNTKKMLPVKLNKVEGELHLAGYIETLRNCPTEVTEDFDCTYTKITNLEGFPKTVGGSVGLVANEELTSLDGMDGVVIGGDFRCEKSKKLTSLHNIHKRIAEVDEDGSGEGTISFADSGIKSNVLGLLRIRGVKKVILPDAKVAEILNKHLEKGDPDIYAAQEELLDAGFDDFAEL